jgi:phosphoesterase RecJ-like protein
MGVPSICACADEIPERLRFISDAVQGSVVIDEDMAIDYDRVISVDSASPSQLGSLFQRIRKDVDIMIDHHKMGNVYADYYIDSEASATGEIIYEIAKKLVADGKLSEIPNRVIQCVYAAISSDTGCFRFANVTPKTHRIAAELLEAGADAVDINHKLYSSKTPKQMRAEGEASRRLKLWNDGRIASVTFPYELKKALELTDEHLETIIDIPRSVSGVEVAFSVRQSENDRSFRVSMRSATDFDVSAICAMLGGGGHIRAAGCTVDASSIEEAENIIYNAIAKRL